VTSDPTKLDGILSWPIPQTVTQIQGFLGFTNFYWKFIPRYSELAEPLHYLSKKLVVWQWGLNQQKAFEDIKNTFKNHVVLQVPDPSKAFLLETDASLVAIAAVLIQEDMDGNE